MKERGVVASGGQVKEDWKRRNVIHWCVYHAVKNAFDRDFIKWPHTFPESGQ